ncbi:protease synthase/sporulation negative transcriptional regulator PaiB [Croceitalea sp. MTPC9]|uniref:FMN-binding negative transcriptional regulator n=1 Tax=unclassified Croceitalea TaxID=2632280 RepID=UPI002B3D5F82|nr:protease synthase/sporulation negative transcriptional regulator PaiB [Croceitalea sp. MTPC6]GMN15316.1 protease synthase/sporulation negative transcriptional regulator PaiB [Croceitalea sp. MTPC9]
MYIPHYYKNENVAEVKDFLKRNSFGILINQVDGKPWATHIPLELEEDENGKELLVSHISRANPQWKEFEKQPEVLCIFNGPHSYISSSWYKEEEVPTWDYIAVHVYGKLTILDEEAVMASLHKLVNKYEKGSKSPISLHEMSSKTLRQVKGVVGFKIEITDIQAAYKLSQTRPEDHAAIIKELNGGNVTSKEIARHIEKQSTHK